MERKLEVMVREEWLPKAVKLSTFCFKLQSIFTTRDSPFPHSQGIYHFLHCTIYHVFDFHSSFLLPQ